MEKDKNPNTVEHLDVAAITAPEVYILNPESIQTIEDVRSILAGMNLNLTIYPGVDDNPEYQKLIDKGYFIPKP